MSPTQTRPTVNVSAVTAAFLLLAAPALATTNNFSIGFNFASDQTVSTDGGATFTVPSTLDPADLAGVPGVKQMNWNNALDSISGQAWAGAYGTISVMTGTIVADSTNVAVPTLVELRWQANGTWSTSGSRGAAENNGTNFFPGTADNRLMTGYMDTTAAGNPTLITISNLPPEITSGAYHVYVYMMGANVGAARGGSVRVLDAAAGTPLTPYKLFTGPTTRPTAYVEDAGVNHTDNGVYMRFTNLAAPNITIEATIAVNPNTGTPRAGVNAVQLVAAGLTDPLVGLASANGQFLYLNVTDLGASVVDTGSVRVTIDGQSTNVPVQVSKQGATTRIVYDNFATMGQFFVTNSNHQVRLEFSDMAARQFTNNQAFAVGTYTTVPAAYAATGVDLTKPGFRARVYQMAVPRGPANGNTTANAERALAGAFTDPDTTPRQPYANQADLTTAGPDGYFVDADVLNWNETAAAAGLFSANSTPPMTDELVPGIPGLGLSTDNYAVEFQFFLDLPAGYYRLGVNSDDGMRFAFVRGLADLFGFEVATRGGSGNTTVDLAVPVGGTYPVRLTWWEGNGGSNFELYRVDLVTGALTLVNDLTAASPIRAYRESTASVPAVRKAQPSPGQVFVVPDAEVLVEIVDGTVAVDAGSVNFTLSGQNIAATKVGAVTTIRRPSSLANLLPGGANNAVLVYTTGGGATTISNAWSFSVGGSAGGNESGVLARTDTQPYAIPYAIIPPGNKVAAGTVDLGQLGFKMRYNQIDRTANNNQGDGGRFPGQGGDNSRMPRPEIQLSGGYVNVTNASVFTNTAQSGANTDWTYDELNVINYNLRAAGNNGAFNAVPFTDLQAPGIPGTGTSDTGRDNYVMEALTYLNLRAGTYLMSVNSDDGFLLTSAPDPRDTLGTVVGYFNAGRGSANPPTSWVCFVVTEDGIYPFRLLYWAAGGGDDLEWMSAEPGSGQRVLINDQSVTFGIAAYTTYTGPARPWVKFSVSPTPWDSTIQQAGPGPIIMRVNGTSLGGTLTANNAQRFNHAANYRPWADIPIGAVLANVGAGAVSMLLNGTPVAPVIAPSGADTMATYTPNPPLPSGSTNTASLIYGGVTNSWTFIVQTYTNLPTSERLDSSAAISSARGFRARVMKLADSTANVQNTLARVEDHLRGVITNANTAVTNSAEPDGAYILTNIINWNWEKRGGSANINAEEGNFRSAVGPGWPHPNYPDDPIPGIGFGTTGEATNLHNFISGEVFAYLDLPAGYVRMGVASDDGFRVTVATGYNTNAVVLGFIDGGKGSTDVPFSFVVPQAGLYPIRLIWLQGTGGASLEIFSYGPNGEKIPVNDPNNPSAIKAYYAVNTGPAAPQITGAVIAAGSITIQWVNGGTLEWAPDVTGPWTSTADSDGSFNEAVGAGNRYYRVNR